MFVYIYICIIVTLIHPTYTQRSGATSVALIVTITWYFTVGVCIVPLYIYVCIHTYTTLIRRHITCWSIDLNTHIYSYYVCYWYVYKSIASPRKYFVSISINLDMSGWWYGVHSLFSLYFTFTTGNLLLFRMNVIVLLLYSCYWRIDDSLYCIVIVIHMNNNLSIILIFCTITS